MSNNSVKSTLVAFFNILIFSTTNNKLSGKSSFENLTKLVSNKKHTPLHKIIELFSSYICQRIFLY